MVKILIDIGRKLAYNIRYTYITHILGVLAKMNDKLFKIVPYLIALALVLVLCSWIFMGMMAYQGIQAVEQQGLQGVVKQLWCGKQENCDLPTSTK